MTEAEAAEQQTFERRIDLGDGSGVQVFRGATQDELLDKLTEAQANATRKIRELNRQAKLGRDLSEAQKDELQQARTVAALTADERLKLTQDIFDADAAPKAIRRVIEAELGLSLDDVKSSIQQARASARAQRERLEAEAFIDATPDYKPCRQNMDAMTEYLKAHRLAVTQKNLQLAYEDLKDGGLLVLETRTEEKAEKTADNTEHRTVRRPRGETATAIRQEQAGVSVPRKAAGPTPAEIERMSPEEYRQRILLPQMAAQRSR